MRNVFIKCFAISVLLLSLQSQAAKSPVDLSRSSQNGELRVRVLLPAIKKNSQIRGFDLKFYQLLNNKTKSNKRFVTSMNQGSSWRVTCKGDRVFLNTKKDEFTLNLKSPVGIETPAGFLRLNGRPYREELRVFAKDSKCKVVNVLNVEKYLDGVVNAEFSSNWSEQAVLAQVVAARTYAYYQVKEAKRLKRFYDLKSTTADQVYKGAFKEDYLASQLVKKTKGMVLVGKLDLNKNPKPIKAFYHSVCGGKTELPQNVWGKRYKGYRRSVYCPYCHNSPGYQWDHKVTTEDIKEMITKQTQGKQKSWMKKWPRNWKADLKISDLRKISLKKNKKNSSRVDKVVLRFRRTVEPARRWSLEIDGARFRTWMGNRQLKSTNFKVLRGKRVAKKNRLWKFRGNGNGHGVGLCQWGAKKMGEKGHEMASILRHYYPEAKVKKVW